MFDAVLSHDASLPQASIRSLTIADALQLTRQGYVARTKLFETSFADALPGEIDRLIEAGVIKPALDRVVGGQPTEWIASFGGIGQLRSGSARHEASPLIARLFTALQNVGYGYNLARERAARARKIASWMMPAIAVAGMELNVNRVVGTSDAVWSGLHLHTDMTRFNTSLRALDHASVAHAAVRARVFTVTGYARPIGADGSRLNDLGGALPMIVRPGARNPGDRAVFDIVPAYHNSGAFFFAGTVHGVGRMTIGGVRYSFQAFYPSAVGWDDINRRIAAGE